MMVYIAITMDTCVDKYDIENYPAGFFKNKFFAKDTYDLITYIESEEEALEHILIIAANDILDVVEDMNDE